MNEMKYAYVWSKGVMWKGCSHICRHTHMYDDLVNGGALTGVLKCTLNYMVLEYAMSMWKTFSHDLGWWTLIYDLWAKHMRSQSPTAYGFIK